MVGRFIRSNVLGLVAIFLALGGIGYAAGIKKNSVGSRQIKNGQVENVDLAANSVDGSKVIDGSITSADLADSLANSGDPNAQLRISGNCPDGAALAEISDNDGAGSGLDADTVDGTTSNQLRASCPTGYDFAVVNLCFEEQDHCCFTLPDAVNHCRTAGTRVPSYAETLALIQAAVLPVGQTAQFDWTSSAVDNGSSIYIETSSTTDADGIRTNSTSSGGYVRCVVQPIEAS